MRSEVLFIGGRSGVGKSSAAFALHELLIARDVRHAVIEGDTLDLAHPAPHVEHPGFGLAERNLRAIWAGYRQLGHHRLVYTNTLSVLETAVLADAMADEPQVTAVLLRASDAVVVDRLDRRAGGSAARAEVARSARSAAELDGAASAQVHRVDTDGLSPSDVAERLLDLVGWSGA